jgi:hypothetical protein
MPKQDFDLDAVTCASNKKVTASAGSDGGAGISCDIRNVMHNLVVRPAVGELRLPRVTRSCSMPAAMHAVEVHLSIKNVASPGWRSQINKDVRSFRRSLLEDGTESGGCRTRDELISGEESDPRSDVVAVERVVDGDNSAGTRNDVDDGLDELPGRLRGLDDSSLALLVVPRLLDRKVFGVGRP